jgi:rhodanese-related sulfurtransferase
MGLDEFYPLQLSGDVLIYDVRVAYFYNIDHVPGAVNWPYTKYEEEIQQRDIEIQEARNAGKPIVLYCTSLLCPEARNVAKKLTRRGYNVSVLSMGMDSWRDAGLPVE